MKNKFYVWLLDFGKPSPTPYDILPYLGRKWGELKPAKKKEALKNIQDWVERELMHQFWARCEYEMLVLSWPPRDKDKPVKVDVYQQTKPNLELITRLFKENEKIN